MDTNLSIETTGTAVAEFTGGLKNIPHYLVPQSLADVEKIAAKMSAAGWVPKSYRDRNGEVNRSMVELAIMHGATVGIPAIMAPQVIAVINGMPSIYGDGMLGLVRSSGLLEDIREWIEGEGDEAVAYCEVKRKGQPMPIKRDFGVVQAKRAGLWGKEGPWTAYTRRMLQMRARGFTLRDGFADVLKGLRMAEEILDEIIDITPDRPAVPAERPKPEDYRAADKSAAETAKAAVDAGLVPGPVVNGPLPDAAGDTALKLYDHNGVEKLVPGPEDFPLIAGEQMVEAWMNGHVAGLTGWFERNQTTLDRMPPSMTAPLVEKRQRWIATTQPRGGAAPAVQAEPAGDSDESEYA